MIIRLLKFVLVQQRYGYIKGQNPIKIAIQLYRRAKILYNDTFVEVGASTLAL